MATEITQLLVDIQALDDAKIAEKVRNAPGHPVDLGTLDLRIERFKTAFSFMFPNKQYKGITNYQNSKRVVFEHGGKEVFLDDLSSGEKQVVFRGSFILRNQRINIGSVVLLDEPEISLHPAWQLKVLEFYKLLLKSHTDQVESQLFVATHSPFIIHNDSRLLDKVIVLEIDSSGYVRVKSDQQFYDWTFERHVAHAFNLHQLIYSSKPILLTEGKTDAVILRTAWQMLYPTEEIPFEITASGLEIEEDSRSGNADHVRRTLELAACRRGQ